VSSRSPERGLVESTQWAVLIPLLMVTLFAVVQTSLWFAGRAVAQQAAMAAAEHAAFAGGGSDDPVGLASGVAARGGLRDVQVDVSDTGAGVRVSITAQVPTVVPGDWSVVQASAHRVKEQG
jgi:hypothetical protein